MLVTQLHCYCLQVPLGSDTFTFFGREYSSLYVGSNGYITLGSGDFRFQSTVGSQNPKVLGSRAFASIETETMAAEFSQSEESTQETEVLARRLQQSSNEARGLEGGATHWDLPRISLWFQVVDSLYSRVLLLCCSCILKYRDQYADYTEYLSLTS